MSHFSVNSIAYSNSVQRQIKAWAALQEDPGLAETQAKAEICRRLNIKRGTLHAKLRNRRQFRVEELVVVGQLLGCDWRKLMDVAVNPENVPL